MERARRAAAAALTASALLIGGPRLAPNDPLPAPDPAIRVLSPGSGIPHSAPRVDSVSPALSTTGSHLRMQGHRFVSATGAFQWRGISAFALVDQEADGRRAEVVRFLDWAAA